MEEFYRIKRLPPYVFSIVDDLKMKARHRGDDIIDLGMGNPDLPTPPHIVEKLVEAVKNPRNHRYSASRGIFKLRSAIAGWYAKNYGVEIDPDTEAIVTIGRQRRACPSHPGHHRGRRCGVCPHSVLPDPPLLGHHRRRRPAHHPPGQRTGTFSKTCRRPCARSGPNPRC